MYEDFYGLRERPFELTPDPRYLLLTEKHRAALAHLNDGIAARSSIVLLVGEAGTGKTTLLRALVSTTLATDRIAMITNPALSRDELREALAIEFHLSDAAAQSKARLVTELADALRACATSGGSAALIIDEAQNLPDELLHEIRLLTNLESDTARLLPIVLSGTSELIDRLRDSTHRSLRSRVARQCTLAPLSLAQTGAYIAGRIRIAGGDPASIFTAAAVAAVYAASGGIPRTISLICDNAIVAGFETGQRPIDQPIVAQVCDTVSVERQPSAFGRH